MNRFLTARRHFRTHCSKRTSANVNAILGVPSGYLACENSRFSSLLAQVPWHLAQVPWYENALIDDAGEKVEHFNDNFLEILERYALVRKRKVINRQCPFLDQEIKELMDDRDKVHRVTRESGAVTDWEHYR